jgi:hypothetical protein
MVYILPQRRLWRKNNKNPESLRDDPIGVSPEIRGRSGYPDALGKGGLEGGGEKDKQVSRFFGFL